MKDLFINAKSFFFKSKRVWHVLKKPSREEFEQTTKISAIGILIVGALGFAISIIMNLFL
jgi:protein transport protein SEC61 subunit gamma-like protein|tara:strand:- start:2593 stop:2772 length:180 start_codon:yes stop_codon:yes gene_type:complete